MPREEEGICHWKSSSSNSKNKSSATKTWDAVMCQFGTDATAIGFQLFLYHPRLDVHRAGSRRNSMVTCALSLLLSFLSTTQEKSIPDKSKLSMKWACYPTPMGLENWHPCSESVEMLEIKAVPLSPADIKLSLLGCGSTPQGEQREGKQTHTAVIKISTLQQSTSVVR